MITNTTFDLAEFRCSYTKDKTIYTVRKTVDHIVEGGSTVNICSIDLKKAFDKVNHSALYIKLTKQNIPVELLGLLENWLSDSFACVKWHCS